MAPKLSSNTVCLLKYLQKIDGQTGKNLPPLKFKIVRKQKNVKIEFRPAILESKKNFKGKLTEYGVSSVIENLTPKPVWGVYNLPWKLYYREELLELASFARWKSCLNCTKWCAWKGLMSSCTRLAVLKLKYKQWFTLNKHKTHTGIVSLIICYPYVTT